MPCWESMSSEFRGPVPRWIVTLKQPGISGECAVQILKQLTQDSLMMYVREP